MSEVELLLAFLTGVVMGGALDRFVLPLLVDDLGGRVGDVWFVGEVKSPTAANEATQIRLGIAQLLEYRYVLRLRHPDVKAVLILEREPDMTRWSDLSKSLEIEVVWPGTIDAYLATVV